MKSRETKAHLLYNHTSGRLGVWFFLTFFNLLKSHKMRTFTTKEQIVPSVDISGESITFEMLREMRKNILECRVEFLRVTFKNHSIILHKFTDLAKVFEHFKDLEENYCEYCNCDIGTCNEGFTDEDGEHYQFAV
jgi:hypothetical protein